MAKVIDASAAEPVRFVLPRSDAFMTHGAASASGEPAHATSSGASSEETLPESRVSVPARLLVKGPVPYPALARAAEIEADVPVEIVVDTSGRVVEARALARSGYGLDEAAVTGVRGYRFSAALRDGRSVRVRMRWVVQFRLG